MKIPWITLLRKYTLLLPLLGVFSFSGLDLSQDNRLLFQLDVESSGPRPSYSNLLMNDLNSGEIDFLNYFPEEVYYQSGSESVFIHNRLGLFKGDLSSSQFQLMDFYNHFSLESTPSIGPLEPVSISPDGRFLLYFDRKTYVQGNLVIRDLETEKEHIVTQEYEPLVRQTLVKWSPNSRIFCYAKEGKIYYFSIDQWQEQRNLLESAHVIGDGEMNSCSWANDNSLYYIDERNIYRIPSTEMFALSFYDTALQIGTVAGRLFVDFDGNLDHFWVSPGGDQLLIQKGEGNLFIYDSEFRDYNLNSHIESLPFLKLPVGYRVEKVLWSSTGKVSILAKSYLNHLGGTMVFLYDPQDEQDYIVDIHQSGVKDMVISPDEDLICLVYDEYISIRDYQTWEEKYYRETQPLLHVFWENSDNLLLFGWDHTARWNIGEDNLDILFYSQIDSYGFDSQERVTMVQPQGYFQWNADQDLWTPQRDEYIRESRQHSSEYRVYLEQHRTDFFEDMIMLRKIEGYGTLPLISSPPITLAEYPLEEQNGSPAPGYFIHGSRIRRRELALTFNIHSEDDGLMDILNTLAEYGIRATFFVNGDFIRKYPGALRVLVNEGHEIGSLFYSNIDLADRQYDLDEDFIIRGLARNEDDFFRATGHEITTLWHAPWYYVNTMIIEASKKINYTYVSRDIDSLDWVSSIEEDLYAPSSQLVERIIEQKQPGSIISLNVGVEGPRDDYLYQRLDAVLDAFLSQGYRVVEVSELIENSR